MRKQMCLIAMKLSHILIHNQLTCRECPSRLPGTININTRRVSMTCLEYNTTTHRCCNSPKLITPYAETNFHWFSEIT